MSKTLTIKLPGKAPMTLTAAGSFCSPCEAQALQAQTAAVQQSYQINEGTYEADAAWEGELGFENEFTGDGRFINAGALYFEENQLPMPLRWAQEDVGAHGGAQVIGLIQTLAVVDGKVKATGIIDGNTAMGKQVIEGLAKGTIKGVSLDLDDFEMEVRIKAEVYAEYKAMMTELFAEDDGEEKKDEKDEIAESENEDGYVKVGEYKADDEVAYITKARVRAATLVDIPAFANAYVALTEEALLASATYLEISDNLFAQADAAGKIIPVGVRPDGVILSALLASAPVSPPAEWFEDPKLDGPTPLTFTADGRVYGHIATWGTCHTQFPGACVTPPYSQTNYGYFRTGVVLADNGQEIPTGRLTMATGHAAHEMGAAPAAAHYDNTGAVVADLASGEDSHGIWVSGALRPGLTAADMRELRAAPMSGDWRNVGGNLELIGILAVNTPGFPVPRVQALVASGRTATLIRPVDAGLVVEEIKTPTKLDTFNAKALELNLRAWDKVVGV